MKLVTSSRFIFLFQRFAEPTALSPSEGSRAGVTSPAHVKVEFYLISAKHGTVANRSVYEVEQTGLADNLLNMGDFFRRKGGWVTATELADEGIRKAIKDFGL